MKLRTATPAVRMAALQNCWEAVGRYLFAVPLQTVTTLLRLIDEGRLPLAPQLPTKLEWQGQWLAQDSQGGSVDTQATEAVA